MKKYVFIFVGIFILLSGYWGFHWYFKPPVIQTSTFEIPFGEPFYLDKIQTSQDVVKKEIIKGKVNSRRLGFQRFVLIATNKHHISAKKIITVHVIDRTPPAIHIKNVLVAEAKKPFNMKKLAFVTDNVDKNISDNLIVSPYNTDKIGVQNVTLSVSDKSKNKTFLDVWLKVVDTTKPVITAKNKSLVEGSSIDLLDGVHAEDIVDGDLTKYIQVIGNVNNQIPNTYRITYKVEDSSHNMTSLSVNVTVFPKTKIHIIQAQNNGKLAPMTIFFNGRVVSYLNGGRNNGQHIINTGHRASTWGGASVFSGTDGLNTHFIGHNPGVFSGIQNAKSFIITDAIGRAFSYHVTKIYKVNDYGIGINDKINYWNRIIGTGGGERVTFQTCYNHSINWIVEASLN